MQKRTIDPRVGSNKLDRSSELNTANVNIIIIIGLAAEEWDPSGRVQGADGLGQYKSPGMQESIQITTIK